MTAAGFAAPKVALHLPKATPFLIEQDYAAYTAEQHAIWAELVRRRMPQLEQHAAEEYLEGFNYLDLSYTRLPNLRALSAKLERRTGWNTTAVSGFMPGPAFFEMLAARRFPTTTWLRGRDSLEYTPEPDIFHDVFGHVPMHAHPIFADFLQHYGKVCARLTDKDKLERMGRLFWFTVEFGIIRQNGEIKLYGSGLVSSHGESTYVIESLKNEGTKSGRGPEIRDFNLDQVLDQQFLVSEMQKVLYAVESFDQIYEAAQQAEDRLA